MLRSKLRIRDRFDIRIIPCFNCCVSESGRQREAMRTAMTASRSVEFEAIQARLLIGCLAYNLLRVIRDAVFRGESVKPSMDSILKRFVKVGAR